MEKKDIFILAIDGGGIFGVVPLVILRHIEEKTGYPISRLFHFLAGTSTGGLISLGLTCPSHKNEPLYSARQLLQLYAHYAPAIFSQTPLARLCQLSSISRMIHQALYSQYSSRPMKASFRAIFGRTPLSQALTPTLVPAYAIGGAAITKSRLKLFRSHEGQWGKNFTPIKHRDYLMTDVAMATSAVPTYFIPHWTSRIGYPPASLPEYCLIDGGVAVNDPSLIAYVEASRMFPGCTIHILSLSGGQESGPYSVAHHKGTSTGYLAWSKDIAKLIIGPSVATQQKILERLIQQDNKVPSFLRIQLENSSMIHWNDHNPAHVKALEKSGENLLEKEIGQKLSHFLDQLLHSRGLYPPTPKEPS